MRKFLDALICGVLLVVIVYFLILRFTDLGTNPQGFFVDESSTAFNAYSILNTGADEYGEKWPVYFKAFGEYKNPLYIYSQVPLIEFLGLTREASRGASAFWGVLTILVFALFLRAQKLKLPILLFGVAVFLASPWHFILSRIAFEVISYPFFIVGAMFYLWLFRDSKEKEFKYFLLVSLFLGVSFYSYTTARILSPALLVLAVVIYRKDLSIGKIFWTGIVFAVCLLPALFWELSHPGSLGARYEVVALSRYSSNMWEFILTFIGQYFAHFSLNFLFDNGDGALRHSLAWHSVLLWTTGPLLVLGIIAAIKKRSRFLIWALIGMFVSIVPSAMTVQSPHPLRAIGFLPFAMYFVVLGADYLRRRVEFLWLVVVLLFAFESFLVANHFQKEYFQTSAPWFDKDTYEAVQIASKMPEPYYLSSGIYPGTFETVKFVSRRNVNSTIVVPGQFVGPGTYVLPRNECNRDGIVFANLSTCIVRLKK